jgi:hypothetical protein
LRDKYPMLKDKTTPFAWTALRNPLTTPEGNAEMIAALVEFAKAHGGHPDLVIIDPLANALGGDDADANLMGLLNRRVAELMRAQKCTVLRVHHSGHGNQERARGHSSLPAGVDTEIRVTEQEISLTKQRDDVRGTHYFRLDVVTLGKDGDGDAVTTCIVKQIENNPLSPELSGPQRMVMDALLAMHGNLARITRTQFADRCTDLTPAQRRDLIAVLVRKQYLREENGSLVICERGPLQVFDGGSDAV